MFYHFIQKFTFYPKLYLLNFLYSPDLYYFLLKIVLIINIFLNFIKIHKEFLKILLKL
jgi:hypothetical protein